MLASASQGLILKEGEVFLFTDRRGDIQADTGFGLYYHDTRYLSCLSMQVCGQALVLLDSSDINIISTLHFANDTLSLTDGTVVRPRTLGARCSRLIHEGLRERMELSNYDRVRLPVSVSLMFGADFRDIFDVRGYHRDPDARGEMLPATYEGGTIRMGYLGKDGLTRRARIGFSQPPQSVSITRVADPTIAEKDGSWQALVTWELTLEPGASQLLGYHVLPSESNHDGSHVTDAPPLEQTGPAEITFETALNRLQAEYRDWGRQCAQINTSDPQLNALLERGKQDLRLLSQRHDGGYFPLAGTPWFACPFGRDSLITSLQTLMLNPSIAVGTLRLLARYQGTQVDPQREEQPGKIMHELRMGELARLRVVPHTPYFGTVDATPLFVLLFVETMRWLDSDDLYDQMAPSVWRAIEWIDRYGDVDGDGFVEYAPAGSLVGLRNHVWKDHFDAMQFPDGTLAEPPIAPVEVQAYVYAAKKGLGDLLRRKGDVAGADRLEREAFTLKERFNQAFWMADAQYFAQGLDRDKRPVPTITSNPGHSLWCGIVDGEKSRHVAARLMQPDMLSGWGIRTVSEHSPSYNPMSYHNGSVWPHDNSIIAAGLRRYGFHEEACAVIRQVVQASAYFKHARLPELYCGFAREPLSNRGPVEYPVSCSPQAWSAGAPFLMLQTLLGVEAREERGTMRRDSELPEWLTSVTLSNLARHREHIERAIASYGSAQEEPTSGPALHSL